MSDLVLADAFGRPLTDLRVSVTDRCNFRCRYCMPREIYGPDHAFLGREELLSFEEITRLVGIFAGLGVTKVRLTGGEPLLRRGMPDLVAMLAEIPGLVDIAMTTNAVVLPALAQPLKDAGLHRITASLDAMDDATHRAISDTDVPVERVFEGIEAAAAAGFEQIKVNTVLRRGINDDQVEPLAEYGREHGLTMRWIEYMDVGGAAGWRLDEVVPAAEVIDRIHAKWPLEARPPKTPGQVAETWDYLDGAGTVGVIASVTRPFCRTCSRARLSSVGEVFTCLFATKGTDLRSLVREGADDDALREAITSIWSTRTDRYSEERTATTARVTPDTRVDMSYIGG